MADSFDDNYECDALVVGSGAAGLSAAVTAGHRGLKVLIVEKEQHFGGTTARSGGWLLWLSSPVRELIVEDGAVRGAMAERDGRLVRVNARRGVILACGGFPHDVARRKKMFPHAPTGNEHFSPGPAGSARR